MLCERCKRSQTARGCANIELFGPAEAATFEIAHKFFQRLATAVSVGNPLFRSRLTRGVSVVQLSFLGLLCIPRTFGRTGGFSPYQLFDEGGDSNNSYWMTLLLVVVVAAVFFGFLFYVTLPLSRRASPCLSSHISLGVVGFLTLPLRFPLRGSRRFGNDDVPHVCLLETSLI